MSTRASDTETNSPAAGAPAEVGGAARTGGRRGGGGRPTWRRRLAWPAVIVTAGAVAAACSSTSSTTPPAASSTSTSSGASTSSTAATTTAAILHDARVGSLGLVLTNAKGLTVYRYTPDKPNVSNCTGSCASVWPPVTVPAGTKVTAVSGVNGTLGTIMRSDGTTQVTFNEMPLYTFAGDSKAGQANGQGVSGIWFVISPTGAKTTGSATGGSASGGSAPTTTKGSTYGY
jgi:predicted lipoprotein with Yx(FWY)xxD motif